jgi:hypothetical protein
LITTSRYASRQTRSLARSMAADSGERYVARGKKTISQLALLAHRIGDERIAVIEERGGLASVEAVIAVDELGRWEWKEERLLNSTEKKGKDAGTAAGGESPGEGAEGFI